MMVKVKCSTCETELNRPPHRLKAYKDHFCNKDCRGKFHSKTMENENNPRWRGGRSCGYISKLSMKAIGQRDTCMICGITKEKLKKRMYVHHKDENRMNNEKDNLIVMCPSCHAIEHNRGERLNAKYK